MKARYASFLLTLVVSAFLTLNGVDSLRGRRDRWIEMVSTGLRKPVAAVRDRLWGSWDREPEPRKPGPTYALLIAGGQAVGLDREGYVTFSGTVLGNGDVPVLTRCGMAPDLGEGRVLTPQVSLGLGIIAAFEQHPDLLEMLSEICLADLSNPRAVLCNRVVAELGGGPYPDKVDRLHQVLLQAPLVSIEPRRIDLRFHRQVVVEYRDMKRKTDKEV